MYNHSRHKRERERELDGGSVPWKRHGSQPERPPAAEAAAAAIIRGRCTDSGTLILSLGTHPLQNLIDLDFV